MTKSQAIRKATDSCTQVYSVAHSKWTFNVWNPKTSDWVRQPIRTHLDANLCRTAYIVNEARYLLDRPPVVYEPNSKLRFDHWV